jgi:hypothetical protein
MFFWANFHNLGEREGELQNVHKVFLGKNGFKSTNYEEKKSKITIFGCCLVLRLLGQRGMFQKFYCLT